MEADDRVALSRFVPGYVGLVTGKMFWGGLEERMGLGDGGVHLSVTSRFQASGN